MQSNDAREEPDVDYARVVHSASFRRLQGKTQILNLGDSDFHRTRLTHSLEVAQIAGGIWRRFQKDPRKHPACEYLPDNISMIQAIALTHDLGHPPFGHGGEVALNYCMRNDGGFEGNGQTLRILTRLEKFSDKYGANLTRRALLGVLKYPVPYSKALNPILSLCLDPNTKTISIINRECSKPPKCYMDSEQEVVDWILDPLDPRERDIFFSFQEEISGHHKPLHKSFDCSIMDIADDIAFGVHDLEDVLVLKLINQNDFCKFVTKEKCSDFLIKSEETDRKGSQNFTYDNLVKSLFGEGSARKRFISQMVHYLITHC